MKYTIDATNKKLGRVASEAAVHLIGKNQAAFVRNKVSGGVVEIVNASKADISEKKLLQKKYDLKRLYRLSIEDQKRMLTEQKGRCKICGKLFSEGHFNKPFIDHSHDTYLVRGILCGACNSILGYSRDNIEILKKAIKYLKINGHS